jgi:hypothetical protein
MFHSTWRAGRWPLAITLMTAALAACSDTPTATRPPAAQRTLDVQTMVEEPALVDFSVQETALFDRETGKVHVVGGVTCSAPAKFDIRVSLLKERKRDGTQVVLSSDAVPQIDCTTSMVVWSIALDSPKGLRHNGTVIINVRPEAPATPIQPASFTKIVQLIRDVV